MKTISELRFVANDARANLDDDNRALFHSIFMADETIDRLSNDSIYFLVGEKGTGKTAYSQYVAQWGYRDMQGYYVALDLNDYPKLIRLCNTLGLDYSDYQLVWQVAILLLLHEHIYSVTDDSVLYNEKESKPIYVAISEHGLGAPIQHFDDAFSLLEDPYELASALKDVAGGNAARADPITTGIPIKRILIFIRKAILHSIRYFKFKHKRVIFIDGLDVREPDLPYADFMKCARGLINAVWHLNTEHLNKHDSPRPRIVALIRPEMLYNVGLQNVSSKMRDNAILLDWFTHYRDWKTSKLFRLADNMLGLQQDTKLKLQPHEAWNHYFRYEIDRRGRNYDDAGQPFLGFLRNAFYRPRDIVTIFRLMKQRFEDLEKGENEFFDQDVMRHSWYREKYSEYLMGEIKESLMLYHKPEDYSLLRRFFGYLADYIDNYRHEFNYDQFIEAYGHIENYFRENKLEKNEVFETADRLLQSLFELNIVGYQTKGIMPDHTLWKFCCSERSYSNIKPEIRTHGNYRVHFGIARALAPERIH